MRKEYYGPDGNEEFFDDVIKEWIANDLAEFIPEDEYKSVEHTKDLNENRMYSIPIRLTERGFKYGTEREKAITASDKAKVDEKYFVA